MLLFKNAPVYIYCNNLGFGLVSGRNLWFFFQRLIFPPFPASSMRGSLVDATQSLWASRPRMDWCSHTLTRKTLHWQMHWLLSWYYPHMLDSTSTSTTFLCRGSPPDISSPSQGVQCLKLLGKDSWASHQVRCAKSIVLADTLDISQSHQQSNHYVLMFTKYGSYINLHFCHSGTGIRPSDKHQNDSK